MQSGAMNLGNRPMKAEQIFGAVLIALFAFFLFISLNDLLQLFESRRFGDAPLLLFCAVV
jgi:hypothetical protein